MSMLHKPPCPNSKERTMRTKITLGSPGFGIRTFQCPACGDFHQLVVELVDPMKSRETAGWLRGQLRAPT
jgi:hypothetical protein